jgi:aminopeptidase N
MTETTSAATPATEGPQPVYRKDYRPPAYFVERVDLRFELSEEETLVYSKLEVRRNHEVNDGSEPFELDGEDLDLRGLRLWGRAMEPGEYTYEDGKLRLPLVPEDFELETKVALRPQDNTQLSGLYRSGGIFCTQCEAQGFRRITFFPDRPDVMSRYRVTIVAPPELCPVMLSNGNRIAEGTLDDGRAWVQWEDPHRKPSYLFALVAGDLAAHTGSFTTASGRDVKLEIWVEPRNADKCEHALRSLQAAMKWDEETYGLEYDLDLYMIVAVDDFNMGAMENKGLNIFNSKYVLALPETATDDDYENIEGIIGHEYFHNWTGNRVTCRDWFQLTLKEGLTVYRDEEFSSDRTSRPVKRIQDVRALRVTQQVEDEGPMAHPVRPDSYVRMDNFYTATVYRKGAEVVRIYRTRLGVEGFRRGLDLYFERHDGQAVTCDDFRAAMADANGVDLSDMERWYSQAGTPELHASGAYDADARTYTLDLRQEAPKRGAGAVPTWQPVPLPVLVGLVGPDGIDFPLTLQGEDASAAATTRRLDLTEAEGRYTFTGVDAAPVPSILRGFSAPVKLHASRSRADLTFLMAHDSDSFNRWDAGQELASALLLEMAAECAFGKQPALDPTFISAFGRVLTDPELDGSLKALALALPSEQVLAQEQDVIDPDALFAAREGALRQLGRGLELELADVFEATRSSGPATIDQEGIARRRLHNTCLAYLCANGDDRWIAEAAKQCAEADNMTDVRAALAVLSHHDVRDREPALAAYRERWKDDPSQLDTWFAIQATSKRRGAIDDVLRLAEDPAFSRRNPNRVRSLVATFASGNPVAFHAADGRGYRFVTDEALALDALNPQVAARLAKCFQSWSRFDPARQGLQKAALERLAAHAGLSRDTREVVDRALAD